MTSKIEEPTYAQVRCHGSCGYVRISEEEYDRQMWNAWALWKCPICHDSATFDDTYFEMQHAVDEGDES